jgi:hypothetical protein
MAISFFFKIHAMRRNHIFEQAFSTLSFGTLFQAKKLFGR